MNLEHLRPLAVLLAAAFATASSAAVAQPVRVHLDEQTNVGGIGVGCTGIGQTKDDPKWRAYPVRLEFAAPSGDYLSGEDLTLMGPHGATVLEVTCEGPWILLKLPPARPYTASAVVGGQAPKTAAIRAPAHGQATFVFTFPAAD